MAQCASCSGEFDDGLSFCIHCGAKQVRDDGPLTRQCPTCRTGYPDGDGFCVHDGIALIAITDEAPAAPSFTALKSLGAAITRFWRRHAVLLFLTFLPSAVLILVQFVDPGLWDSGLPIAAALTVIALLCWPVALIQGDGPLGLVARVDSFFDNTGASAREKGGVLRRIFVLPVLWLAEKLMRLSRHAPDAHGAAAVRLFFYIASAATIIGLVAFAIFVIVMIIVGLFVLWLGLTILSVVLDGDAPRPSGSGLLKRGASRAMRGQTLYSGTNWLNEQKSGRVDEDGTIYEGTNWLNERKVGRIDDDGTVYEGTNWLNESKTGRIDDDGTVYEGTNWLNERKTGRVDEDGTVYEGTNWLNERKTGRTERDSS